MKVLWIDPGHTVGWVIANTGHSLRVLDYGNTKLKTFALRLLAKAHEYDVIGYESYTIRPDMLRAHAGSTVPTLQLIGMIRLAAWQAQSQRRARLEAGPQLVDQAPGRKSAGLGAAKIYLPELVPVMREALDGPHDDGHFADALMHTAYWWHKYPGRPR